MRHMRQDRQLRITHTKRKLTYLHQQEMNNYGIGIRLYLSTRTVERWWNDTCPTPMHFDRLCRLVEWVERRIKEDSEPWKPCLEDVRQDGRRRMAAIEKHHQDTPNHGHGECPECIRIIKEWPKLSP